MSSGRTGVNISVRADVETDAPRVPPYVTANVRVYWPPDADLEVVMSAIQRATDETARAILHRYGFDQDGTT